MNNKKIAVITDSCADLPKEIKEKDYVKYLLEKYMKSKIKKLKNCLFANKYQNLK